MKVIRIKNNKHENYPSFHTFPRSSNKFSPDVVIYPFESSIVKVGNETLAFFKKSQLILKIGGKSQMVQIKHFGVV